jgi:hypothetical protein
MTGEPVFTPMAAPDQAVTRESAPAALEQLRADRMNGRVDESAFLQRSEYLHRVLSAQPGAAPPPANVLASPEDLVARDVDLQMSAPAPERYTNIPSAEALGDRAQEFDVGLTKVLARGGIPQAYAPQLVENLFRDFAELSEVSEGERESRLSSVQSTLKTHWGDEFQTRLDRVNDLLADAMEADPTIAHAIERAPWAFHVNVWTMETLDRVAEHRARKHA